MNINDYRRAMDKIVPDTELKERIMSQKKTKYIPVRRVVNSVLAAALAVACLFTVALAASPELRTAVLSFFHMEEREQVPSQNEAPNKPDISQAEIGELVKAQYIKMDHYYGIYGDLLYDMTWSEDRQTLQKINFWEVKDNELVPIQVDMQTSQMDVTFKGLHYQGKVYWFVRQDKLFYFLPDNRSYDEEREIETDWILTPVSDRTDVLMLHLSQGRQMEYTEYPFLYHLDTGEAEDILVGTGADQLEYAYNYDWSEDMRKVIILTGNRLDDQLTWFCDLDANTLVRLDEMVDIDVYTAAFADQDTLILYSITRDEEGVIQDVAFYAHDIPSGRTVKTLDRTPYYRSWDDDPGGAMTFGSRCVLISEEGQVQVVDLKTGDRSVLGGFTYQKGDDFMISPSGNKLLYYSTDPETNGLAVTQLGVVDLEKRTFIAFDREGYEGLYEESIGWSDDNTVSINAVTPDFETRYLLLYQF